MGLFRALITNGARLGERWTTPDERGERGLSLLRAVGPVLLTMLLSDRSVALNRGQPRPPTCPGALGRTWPRRDAMRPGQVWNQITADAWEAGELGRQRDGREVTPARTESSCGWICWTEACRCAASPAPSSPLTPNRSGFAIFGRWTPCAVLPPALAG